MRKLALFVLLLLAGCTASPHVTIQSNPATTYAVEVADTPEARSTGLMNRATLDADKGMLFVFDKDQSLSFWMKSTKIPLDILYIDSGNSIVDIQHMTPCTSEPCQIYYAAQPGMYALEISAGQVAAHNLQVGQTVVIS